VLIDGVAKDLNFFCFEHRMYPVRPIDPGPAAKPGHPGPLCAVLRGTVFFSFLLSVTLEATKAARNVSRPGKLLSLPAIFRASAWLFARAPVCLRAA